MIEVIYKDEKQTAKGNEESFNLPKNIRQIGIPNEKYQIYIEDYVYTFLKKIAEKAEEEEKGAAAVFTGEIKWNSGTGYLFIRGALTAEAGEISAEHVEFSDLTWQKLHEETEHYFAGQEIIGWFLTQKSLQMEVAEGVQRIHMKLFGGEKVLMLMDPVEKEEAFFCYDNGRLLRQSGYYIYYEKNPQMQAYMLEKNPELNQPEQELVADDAVKTFRKIIQKKHTEETQETEERASVFSYAATACLVLAVLTVGVQFYQNYNHKSITDTITDTVSRTANSTEVTKAERQTEKKSVTPTSALKKDLTPIPVSPAATETPPVTSMAAEDNAETDTKNVLNSEKEQEIYREESDTRKAERRVKQEQVENNAAKNKISEDVTDSAVTSSAESGTSYVIKPGDTLYQISISRYGTMEKVADICRANGLTEEEIIYPGQIIVLP